MNNFFTLSINDQQQVLQAASTRVGIPAQAIEKDLWVTTISQIVFSLPFAEKLIFKGGTSLSKTEGLINRFSEDIDLAVDRSLLGYEGDLTKKQIKKLRKTSSLWVKEEFYQAVTQALEQHDLSSLCVLDIEQDGEGDNTYPEPRRVWVRYKNADRKTRHLYDLYMMMDKSFAQEAIRDDILWENIRHHREIFTSVANVDYMPDVRKRILLTPPADIYNAWKSDYEQMCESMIYGKTKPTFAEILTKMQELQELFQAI